MYLICVLATCHFCSLNSAHLGNPGGRWLNLAYCPNLVTGVARNTDVVTAFEGKLNVTNLEDLATALFGILARCLENLVNEIIGDSENRLETVSGMFNLTSYDAI